MSQIYNPSFGTLPNRRLFRVVANQLVLCGGTDTDAVGVTSQVHSGSGTHQMASHIPSADESIVAVLIEVAAGNTLEIGDVAYQAADGKVASTGTVRVGITVRRATAGGIAKIVCG